MNQQTNLDSSFWRYLAWLGAARFPLWWLRLTPGPIGLAAAAVCPDQRKRVRDNHRSIFGPRGAVREQLDVAKTFVTFAQSLSESLAQQGNPDRVPSVEVCGQDLLVEAISHGRGVIIGTAHTAGWESVLMALENACDAPVIVVMRRENDPSASAFHPLAQSSEKRRVLYVGDDPFTSLELLHHLRKGGVVTVQVDRCPEGIKAISTQVANKTWCIPEGPFALCAVTKAPMLLALSRRVGFLAYELCLSRLPDVPRPSRARPEQPEDDPWNAVATEVAYQLASHVERFPTQWFDFNFD